MPVSSIVNAVEVALSFSIACHENAPCVFFVPDELLFSTTLCRWHSERTTDRDSVHIEWCSTHANTSLLTVYQYRRAQNEYYQEVYTSIKLIQPTQSQCTAYIVSFPLAPIYWTCSLFNSSEKENGWRRANSVQHRSSCIGNTNGTIFLNKKLFSTLYFHLL